jgi:drug/metabolite transporter (DMT)-like permease
VNARNRARLEVVLAAVLFSTGGAAIKATTLSAFEVAGLRSGIAAVALLAFLPAARRGFTLRAAAAAVAYAATLVLFVTANKLTTAAATIFLQSTAPLWVLLLGPALLRERASRSDLTMMLPVAAGLLLVFLGSGEPARTAPDPLRGNVLATLSGITWAFTVMGLRWMGSGPQGSPMAAVVLGNLLVLVVCAPFMRAPAAIPARDWMAVAFLGLFQVAAAYVFLAAAVRTLPALGVSLLLLVEPALNPVWTWLVHGERPTLVAAAGGGLILGATALKSWWDVRGMRRAVPG